ncbi:UDP-N-acetylmuramate--L-alanine ligase [soil metagenome]
MITPPGLKQYRYIYLLGIGGIGMSALARYFLADGKVVAGYDRTSTPLTDELTKEGMQIHFEDNPELIGSEISDPANRNKTLVIITPAVPSTHQELQFFRSHDYQVVKRSQVLGMLTKEHFTLAVAGTHGKTTTSSILAHILHASGVNCTAFLGGISVNFGSNLLLGDTSKHGHKVVVEADEFDRSFLTLFPDMAVITSMDADHLDIYGDRNEMQNTYREFASQVQEDGLLLYKSGLNPGEVKARTATYSIEDNTADYRAEEISVNNGRYEFNLVSPAFVLRGLSLGLPGRHNVENAVAACALAVESGLEPDKLKAALESYAGVHRRFEVHIRRPDLVYIDDYAHHPEELRAAISSVKELYPHQNITGIFQPHLFSRTRDFADGFAESLSLLDKLYLLPIYPAREEPIPGVDSAMILKKVKIKNKQLITKEQLIPALRKEKPEVLITLGAGDIDQFIQPIKQLLETYTWL